MFSLVRRWGQEDVKAACQLTSRLCSTQRQIAHSGAWLGDETFEREVVEAEYKAKMSLP